MERTQASKHKQSKHTHNLQSIKYLPTVQKCGSSICSAKVSLLPIGGRSATWFKRTASPPMWPVCLFIKRGWGQGHFLGLSGVMRSSQRESINEWWARRPHHAGPFPDWFGVCQERTLSGYIYWCEGVTLPRNEKLRDNIDEPLLNIRLKHSDILIQG